MSVPENILIYRLGSLGDTVVALPCFHLIRRTYPRSKITLLTNLPVCGKAAPAMTVLENSGLCDDAICYQVATRDIREIARLRADIRRIRPDLLINLTAERGLLKNARDQFFFWSCGIRKIIGTPLRNARVLREADGKFEPEAKRLAARLAPLGNINLADRNVWNLRLTAAERMAAHDLLPADGNDLIAVSVGTKLPAKDWGESNWHQFLALLNREARDATLIMLGSQDESERSERMAKGWSGDYLNLCGKTSARTSAAILEHCRLFVGHDSGPMHLATAVGTPTLALFSWHNPPGQWFPGHNTWENIEVLYPPLPDNAWSPGLQGEMGALTGVRLLKPEMVIDSAVRLMNLSAKARVSPPGGFGRNAGAPEAGPGGARGAEAVIAKLFDPAC